MAGSDYMSRRRLVKAAASSGTAPPPLPPAQTLAQPTARQEQLRSLQATWARRPIGGTTPPPPPKINAVGQAFGGSPLSGVTQPGLSGPRLTPAPPAPRHPGPRGLPMFMVHPWQDWTASYYGMTSGALSPFPPFTPYRLPKPGPFTPNFVNYSPNVVFTTPPLGTQPPKPASGSSGGYGSGGGGGGGGGGGYGGGSGSDWRSSTPAGLNDYLQRLGLVSWKIE
jgi:uncharacterized membrane protein YgcG